MSSVVLRAAYRKTLKLTDALEKQFQGDASKVFFAAFGIALRNEWCAACGWGTAPKDVVRACFARPSIAAEPRDSTSARLAESFDVMHRLSEALKPAEDAKTEDEREKSSSPLSENGTVGESGAEPSVETATVIMGGRDKIEMHRQAVKVAVADYTTALPPYRDLIPPEPFYYKNLSVSSKAPFLVTALHAMAAVSNLASGGVSGDSNTVRALLDSIPCKSTTVTDHVEIEVRTEYLGNSSKQGVAANGEGKTGMPAKASVAASTEAGGEQNFFRYVVFIRNYSSKRNPKNWTVTLLSRHWVFLDADSRTMVEVIGPGVVGNMPEIQPGDSHVYESGTVLTGRSGVMTGTFQFMAFSPDGQRKSFDAVIGPTRLS